MGFKRGERKERRENLNSKTLFYKDCSLGSVKNLSNLSYIHLPQLNKTASTINTLQVHAKEKLNHNGSCHARYTLEIARQVMSKYKITGII